MVDLIEDTRSLRAFSFNVSIGVAMLESVFLWSNRLLALEQVGQRKAIIRCPRPDGDRLLPESRVNRS